jgi:ribosomal protein S12 methylthiotransferase accessory factor
LDLTADLNIPAFAAVSHRTGGEKEKKAKKENILFGFGAHVDARIAVERALIELNQLLPIAEAPGTDRDNGKYLTEDKTFIDWLNNAVLDTQPYLAPVETAPLKKAGDYQPICKPTIYDSLVFCIETAAEHGMETLVLDLTRRDVGLPAVKVVVPGLRHFWKRLAPGRLYNVPVKMGWLDSPLNEDEMNPIGIFI